MSKLITSASKIVLIVMTFSLAIAFLYATFTKQVAGDVIADIFKVSLGAVLGFYFANKGEQDKDYLGK